jgi:hypothetical protein
MASAGAFTFRVLVGMLNAPAHVRSVPIAECILGTSCTDIEIAPQEVVPEDDDREFFVTAWCIHPRLVLDEKILAILEPLFLDMHEDMMELPALRCWASLSPTLEAYIPLARWGSSNRCGLPR